MTEFEKMEALKRAYAEMILNTAKEAAARVMAAELRARRLEQDLIVTKEDGAQMLLRLKQMIDAKANEAEITSLNQQRKFDELESQLNEAEGIILDLRAELNHAKEQLDESNKKKLSSMRQNEDAKVHEMTLNGIYSGYELFTDSGPEFVPVDGNNSCLDHSTLDQKCCGPVKQSVRFNSEKPTLDQMNEPKLFRYGSTQKICPAEIGLVQVSFPVEENSNPNDNLTNAEIVNAVGSSSVLEENIQQGENEAVPAVRRSLRKRKLKFWDDIITACGLRRAYQFKKPRQAFPHPSCHNSSKAERCINSSEDQFQAEDGIHIEESLDHEDFRKEENTCNEVLPANMKLIDVLVKQDDLAATFELTSSSRIACDIEGAVATKASDPSHADGNKLYKYTFSRKWKKKSIIYPEESSSLEESLLKKENGNSGFGNSSLLTESYRDSRQLVQIAHQLISLSGSSGSTVDHAEEF
ncbi:hypothetical protein CDL12_27711 [Handroanthus impetiginosus]|uniref:Uncharacterized protein n=1 Tax=Handroanthus impetiginosus TaxID=429701 RepID=A0A2G9G394_9LAMI|nr:hypothetical protein CDL12_27711 [Handroanthus impetiginosus]